MARHLQFQGGHWCNGTREEAAGFKVNNPDILSRDYLLPSHGYRVWKGCAHAFLQILRFGIFKTSDQSRESSKKSVHAVLNHCNSHHTSPYHTIPIVPYPTYHGAWLRKITITVTQRSISVHTVWFQDLLGQGNPYVLMKWAFPGVRPKDPRLSQTVAGVAFKDIPQIFTRDSFDLGQSWLIMQGHFLFVEFRRNGMKCVDRDLVGIPTVVCVSVAFLAIERIDSLGRGRRRRWGSCTWFSVQWLLTSSCYCSCWIQYNNNIM